MLSLDHHCQRLRPGLIHVSELAHGYVKAAGDVVKAGDEVEAKVLDVDRRKRQIRLSIKAMQEITAEESAPEPVERRSKGKRKGKKKDEEFVMEEEASTEPEFTAMQIAWQQAMEKANGKNKVRAKSIKSTSQEQESILSGTLEKRLPTGG